MGFNEISSKYQAGHIVELKVQKLLTEVQLIVFELEGVSARLHVSNLSNSPDLSRRLFSVIRPGELISSVIIDFNHEKQYVELSLKPFRNHLEGSLSFTKCRNIIDARKEMRTNLPKDILEENRNQLDRIQGDLAKVDLTFLYELIQNAIDHPNPNFNNLLSIKFEVYNDYLLLKHNGSIFTENNFRSLTGILLGEEDVGEARIGYKGIGFKSIFRYTQEVYIRSGNFSFGFSKQRTGSKMPWEVIPIFENEIEKVEEIKNFEFFNTPVAFAFKFTNPELKEQAIQYLEQLVALPETLLFLDKLTRLEVVVGDRINKINREVIKYNSYNKINLQLNEELPQEWLVCQETNTITDEMILKELKDENNPSIPLKFRNFNTPQVQIAFPLVPGKELINMYAYLPLSETKCGLPYILNGDFIPNLDRTDVIKNLKYNNSLANLASKTLSKLFRIVSKEYGIEQALSLISKSDDSRLEFFKHLTESFVKIKDELCIVTNTHQEVALKNFVIDKSGLFSILKSEQIQLLDTFKDSFVFGQLNSNTEQFLIDKIGLRVFTIQNAIELLSKPEISTKLFSTFTDVVKFLFQISRLKNKAEWFSKTQTLKAIKQCDNSYALNEHYYGVQPGFEKLFENTLNIISLSSDASALIEKRPRITEMLIKFGLKEFNLSEALRQLLVLSDKLKAEANTNTIGQVWHFLYVNRNAKNLDGSRLVNDRFKSFPINTVDDKVEKLENCFAGDVEEADGNFSFLYENFGKENLAKVNIAGLAKLAGADNKEIIDFLKTIHENVKLTDKTLFKRALKSICSTSKDELKDREDSLLKALISVFYYNTKFPKENLIEFGMLKFPVLTQSNELEQISFTYFDKAYSPYINTNELYAKDLFNNIEGVSFISASYLKECLETDKESLVKFFRNHFVSPGLKYFNSTLFRKGDKINLEEIDFIYKNYNSGYSNFKSSNDFYIFKDIAKLSGAYNNLILFWKVVGQIKPINLLATDITCNSYSRPNPFIWLLRTTENMFPMQGNIAKSSAQIHVKKLSPYLLNPNDKLADCFNENTDNIIDKLSLKSTLGNTLIINCLQNLNLFSEEQRKIILLEHFAKANFSAEEIEKLKSSGHLLAQDKTIQKINELIYLEKSLESSSILLEQITYPENKIMFTFEYDLGFRKAINQLKLQIRGVEHVELESFDAVQNSDSDTLKTVIIDIATKQKLNNSDLVKLEQCEFKLCSKITLSLKDIIDFHSEVESFYQKEKNVFYYTEIRELTELLCELYKWPISENKKLRKLLDKVNGAKSKYEESSKAKNIEFDREEIEQINKLFGRELEENELLQENLFAQVKALRYFKDKEYTVSDAEDQFKDNFAHKYLGPIKDKDGKSLKVMCRSARKGILFLGAYAWKNLGDEDTILYILTGDKSTDNIIVKDQYELEDKLNSHFKVIRRVNTTVEDITKLLESETNLKDMQFLYKVKSGEYDIIFNPKQNKPGESSGSLTDIGIDV
jgi:hypothetical protein